MYENFSKIISDPKQKAFYEWILGRGVEFKGRTLTRVEAKQLQEKVSKRLFTKGMCFLQSQTGAVDGELRYFEGQATTQSLQIPLEHAWLVDKEGKVWDATWEDGLDYFGIEIPTPFVRQNMLETGEAQYLMAKYYMEAKKNGSNTDNGAILVR